MLPQDDKPPRIGPVVPFPTEAGPKDPLWRGTPDPDRKWSDSHPWSYYRTRIARTAPREVAPEPPAPPPHVRRRARRVRAKVRPPVGQAAVNAAVEACPRGHEYTPANTYRSVSREGWSHRKCRTCALDYQRQRRAAEPQKPLRVGPRGAAALALASPACRNGHPWDQANTIIRGGEGKLSGTRLCRKCREQRKEALRLERWRTGMNARADAQRAQREAEALAFAEHRLELARARQEEQLRERRRNEWVKSLLRRWTPDGEPDYLREPVRPGPIQPRAVRFEQALPEDVQEPGF
jgi:hypothetical protein